MRSSSRLLRLSLAAAITLLIMVSWFIGRSITSAEDETVPDQPSGLSTEPGDTQVRLSWEDPSDSSITKYQLWQIAESETLTGDANTKFGFSVAVSGDEAVVGMPEYDDTNTTDSGAVLVFTRDPDFGVWTQAAKLTASDAATGDEFGSSVAFDGTTIVVGAYLDDDNGDGSGSAYVFTKPTTGDGWADGTETAKLIASDAAAGDEFGWNAVAVDGDTVVVGAYADDGTKGAAYVFTKPTTGDGWADWDDPAKVDKAKLTAKLTVPERAGGDYFGNSVAVDGNTVVIGANGDDGDDSDPNSLGFMGSAFVFVKPGTGDWVSTNTADKMTAFTRGNQDNFGRSVAIDGDTIVVGAYGTETMGDGSQVKTGSAFVFAKPSGGWATRTETAKLTASDGAADDKFGYSVAVDGDTVVVGAYQDDYIDPDDDSNITTDSGAAYAFTKPGTGWADGTETAKLTASDRNTNHKFGSSVAIDGDTIVIGAENNDAAYVFDIVDWDDIDGAGTTSHIVRRLTNGIEHTFRVRAVNTKGKASDPSDSVPETPNAASYAPARPVNFSAAQTGEREVELTWDAHLYPLTVSGYEYNQDGGDWNAITGSDSSTHSHTVTGLIKGTTYTFAVRAVNSTFNKDKNSASLTASDSRSVTIVAKPAAPDSFTAVAGDEQVWLGWRSPADFTISGYEYQQKEGTDAFGVWQTISGSRSGTTFHIVTGLTNGTSYTFQVRAVNAAGESGSSGEQSATPATASSAPVKPEGFSARQTGIGQVELTWEPSSNPLNVTGYQFEQSSGSWTTIPNSDSSTVSHTITGLTQGVAYTFRVRAVNSAGSTESDSQSVTVVDIPAAPDPFAAETGDTQVRLTWDDPGNASITKYQLWQFPPTSIRLTSDDRAELDELGWSVAVDGDTLVIGATGGDPDNTGAAYVFTRDARGWSQVGKLTAAVRRNDAGFGYGVAVHGDTIVVGAYEDDFEGGDAGAAYVFTRPANGWADMTQTARLTAGSDAADGDEFGKSVAVDGDTIMVGAPEEDALARGSAYIFTRPANGWGNWSTLDADGKAGLTATLRGQSNGDRFGTSVAVYGDTVVVGAAEENDKKGAAYVFTKSAATGVWDDWNNKSASDATARLIASDRANNDRFGRAVAMDGDTVIVGAYLDDGTDSEGTAITNSGSAYVFTKPASGGWVSTSTAAKLTASDRAENDEFGYSVAVDGDTVVVGAYRDDSSRGSAYLFSKPPTGWTDTEGTDPITAYDRSGNDRFGNFVAVDGDTVLVGAVGDDSDKGSAYVFGTGEWADIPGSGAGTISHIAKGLRNNVKHTFRVRAVNAVGEGGASEVAATPVAAESGPSRPADFKATQTGVGQVRLAWTASTEPLTVRRYQYKQNDGSGFGNWIIIEGSDSSTASHTVTGLIAGIEYSFTVGAVNGGGQNASEVESVTLEAQAAPPSGFDADVGDEQVKLSWDDPGDSTIAKYQLIQIDTSKLTASDGLRGDEFGISVAVDGDTAVIGAYQDDHTDAGGDTIGNAGSAYVFTKVSGVWSQVAKLSAFDAATGDEFGYSVAVDGETVVVGAHLDDHTDGDTDDDEGAVYVFTKPFTGWADMTQTAKLTAFGAAASDEFGISVAVDGNTVLVGAHQYDSGKGAAYVFTKPYTGWADSNETAKFIASDAAANDEFGISVALDGDTAVIGAYQDDHTDDGGNTIGNAGSAYVFTKVSGVWSQKAKLIASDGAANDEFGISVAVNSDTVVVGAYQDDDNGNKSGSAYAFTKIEGGWNDATETAKLTASDGAADDKFGYSVAVDGDTVVIGAPYNDYNDDDGDTDDDEGSAYVFTRDSAGGWRQRDRLTASDGAERDGYGYSVGVSGDTVVVGAYSDDGNEANTGAAYFLRIPGWTDILDSAATTTSHIVTGLTNDEEHTFQVRGVNAAGGGLASDRVGGTPTFAIPDQPAGLTAVAGDTVVDLTWVDPEDSTIDKYQLLQIIQGRKLATASTDDPVVRGDHFGYSVAVDGNTAVVGAYKDDNNSGDSGSAYVFTRSSPTAPWSWAAKLTASDGAENDKFGISVAVHDDTIVVGAHQDDDSGDDSGSAYVFARDSSMWSQKAKLTASDAATGDEFGISVAVHGDTIVVGAHQDDYNDDDSDTDNDEGSAYVFTKSKDANDETVWGNAPVSGDHRVETAKLIASDAAAGDEFGITVAVDGDTAVIGARQDDTRNGSAYVFTKSKDANDETVWGNAPVSGDHRVETAKLIASDGAASDEFGSSVAVSGDTVVVGAHQNDADGDDSGSAYVFTKPTTGDGWADWDDPNKVDKAELTAKLIASDAATGDEFGISVTIDGDAIAVGAYLDDANGTDSGSAYVFTRDSSGWSQKTKLTGPSRGRDDWLGYSVALDGDTVVAGAYQSNDSGLDSGAVYLWVVPEWVDIDDIDDSEVETLSYSVTSLTNRVEYTLQARAVDKVQGAGAGPPSDPVRATPLKPKPAKPTGLFAVSGDSQVKLSWELPDGSPPINNYQLWQHAENPMLTAPSPTAQDEFGYAVAIDGDTAVVGVPGEDHSSKSQNGSAFVFTLDSGKWTQKAELRPSTADENALFGNSVALQGDTIVVSAPREGGDTNIGGSGHGAVYVFTKPAGGWGGVINDTARLIAFGASTGDEFGFDAVAVNDAEDTIVVGAYNINAAYIFTKSKAANNETVWGNTTASGDHTVETTKLSGSGDFGISVAITGDTIVVGASGLDSAKGSAYVFNSTGDEVAKLTAYSRNNNDRFGKSVAIDDDTIVVGAYKEAGSRGSAYVFTKPATGWANSPGTETAQLTASDRSSNDSFGQSVAVDGDTVVVGADKNGGGAAYVFTKPAAGWADSTESARLTESDIDDGGRYGISVAVDGDTVMVGSNGQGDDEGAAYLYDIRVWANMGGSAAGTTSHFVTALTNDVKHTFAIRAVNYGGESGRSDQVSAEPVGAGSVPVKPRNFSAVQIGTGEVRLEWGQVADPLNVTGYEYKQDTGDGNSTWTPIAPSNATTVSDLSVDTTYTFALRAINSAGASASSDPRDVTIAAAPAAPTNLNAAPGDSQVLLSWRYSGYQTSITGFQYQQKTGGDFGDDWTDITGSTAGTRSHIVTGLANGTEYTFRVRAVNVTIGSDAIDPPASARPTAARSRPDRPANFVAVQTGVGQVELKWDAVSLLNVTGYAYGQDGSWTPIQGSDSSTVSYTVSGLTEETTYTFAVRALNNKGPSASSNSRSVTLVAIPGRPTGVSATDGDTQVTIYWNVPGEEDVARIDKYQLLQLAQSKLTADDGAANDEFGYSVAVDDDTVVIGAYQHNITDDQDITSGDAGSAYVFTRDSITKVWEQTAKLTASVPAPGDKFGYSVAVDGDTVVVGAYQHDITDDQDITSGDAGAAYVFTEVDGVWSEPVKLTASVPAPGDYFGYSVAVDGDVVVVGASTGDRTDTGGNTITDSGAAYVFTKVSGVWSQAAKLTASDGAANDEFGVSVAIEGDAVVVGAHKHDANSNSAAGASYIFTKPATGWANDPGINYRTETARLTAPDGAANDEFGISVAVHGDEENRDTIVVGAHQHDITDDQGITSGDAGAAYVFKGDPYSGKWSYAAKLTASDAAPGDEFGISVAVDGSTVVVGAYLYNRADGVVPDSGSTYVFARDSDTGVWSQTRNLAAPNSNQDDRFGYSVAVDAGTLLAGAPQDDENPGFAYAIDISDAEWADFVPAELTLSDDDRYVYRVLNLTNDQEYAFRVRSVNAAANRPSGETVAATPMLAKPGKTEGLSAQTGDRRVTLSWDDPRDSSIDGYQVLMPPEQTKLTAGSDGEESGLFGESVAVDGDTVVVGAYKHDITDNQNITSGDAGAAYVFTKVDGVWSEPVKLTASVPAPDDHFGYSVAVDGNVAVVGAYQHDITDDQGITSGDAGAAYVFTKVDGVWSEPVKLTASVPAPDDHFGYSVAVDGDTIVVGARGDEDKTGAAYVFTKVAGVWSQAAKLTASGGGAFDYFGHSVAVDDETIVIGAQGNSGSPGAAYVFTKPTGGVWADWDDPNKVDKAELTAKLTASDADNNDQFGYSVAVDGDTVVVGAPNNNEAAYVFILDSGGWREAAKLAASDTEGPEEFGDSVAIRGGTIVIGAYYANIDECEDDDCEDDYRSGAAYVFTKPDGAVWANDPNEDYRTESGKLILPTDKEERDDVFGNSVALDGQSIVAGAPQDNNDKSGSVYVSDIPKWAFLASGAKTTSATVGGLTNGVEHTFQVRAFDGKVEGLPSDSVRATPMPAPAAPTNFSATARNASVRLAWDDPDDSGITRYEYRQAIRERIAGGDGNFGPAITIRGSSATTTSHTVRDLINHVTYRFQIRAVNVYGAGDWSPSLNAIPRAPSLNATPRAPNRNPYFIGGDSVTFTIDENTSPGTPVGSALTATDPNWDTLSYSLSGTDASSFGIDRSTGQLIVKHPLDFETQSVYEVTVRVSDDRNASDDVDVTITITNVDEAGMVSVSLEQPAVGAALTVSLSDPDGSVSDISWQWAASSDGSNWSDISGANSDSYTPVADDVGIYLRATASYTDRHGSGRSTHAVMERQTAQRAPSFEGDVTLLTVDENTPPGTLVGDAIIATDPDGDILTYSLSGTEASSFVIDGSTGQITVGSGTMVDYESGPARHTVIVSVHDGRDAYGNDDSTIDDRIEVSIDVSNVDEAGTVSVSPEQPESGTALTASLSDPDGSLSDISWQWAASSDGSNWSDISGANSDSYTPVADDVGIYLQATASYTDGHGSGRSAHAVMERQTAQRDPSFEGGVTLLTVDENTPPGTLVGDAITATDPDGDILTYSLSGTEASSFVIDGSTGQITVGSGTMVDYESGPARHTVIVSVHDGRDAYGNDDSTIDDRIEVSIDVSNVDEAGTVSVSPEQPESGTALTASLSDPDGSLSDISWQWAASSDGSNWSDISGANSDSYTPVADDVGIYLQATASYTDGHGSGRSAHAVMERQTAQRDPSFEGGVTLLTVDENTPPGTLVGDAITATDPDGDILTYSLSGTEASSFVIDGSTGQITVGSGTMVDYESGPARHTVIVSVHDGRDAYGNDDSTIDDRIEVSIDVSNVDEAGTVSVSPEQPESGTALTASLSDPDGSLSDISWQWAASSDGSNWSDISGANSDSYTPVADDVGIYLQATASYTDGHGSGRSAHAVMERQTAQRDPSFEGGVTLLTVDENTPPGTLVGDAITATDPDGDILTYSLSGTEASSFVIDGSTGQITVGSGTMVDYESGPARHTVIVSVHDGRDAYGNDDSTIDDRIEVSIDVSNVDEAGTVSVSPEQPESGTALTASLSDPDGSLSDISWQWAASSDRANWQDTAGASSSTYTPVDLDADKYLRVMASYADGEGSGKQAQAVLSNPVQGLPEPVATPTPTVVPSPTPVPIVPVDDGGISLWWIILMAAGAVAGAAVIYIIVRKRGPI